MPKYAQRVAQNMKNTITENMMKMVNKEGKHASSPGSEDSPLGAKRSWRLLKRKIMEKPCKSKKNIGEKRKIIKQFA